MLCVLMSFRRPSGRAGEPDQIRRFVADMPLGHSTCSNKSHEYKDKEDGGSNAVEEDIAPMVRLFNGLLAELDDHPGQHHDDQRRG